MADEPIPVRFSHLMRECAVGAIVRGPDHLVVVQDTTTWKSGPKHQLRYVERVRASLGVEEKLYSPPVASIENGRVRGPWVPATRFPKWTRCSICQYLQYQPWKHPPDDRPWDTCGWSEQTASCHGRLEQVPWVLVHENGYLADVPWHALAHSDAGRRGECPGERKKPYLRVMSTDDGHRVHCQRCNAFAPVGTRFPFGDRTWQQPWHREPTTASLKEPAWILGINDVRVHIPHTASALVIPPESRIRRGTVVDRLHGNRAQQSRLQKARSTLQRRAALKEIARALRCRPGQVEEALKQIAHGYPPYEPDEPHAAGNVLDDEYGALISTIPDLREDEDFVPIHRTAEWNELAHGRTGSASRVARTVDRLVAVERLQEIMVFRGFSRIENRPVTPPHLTGRSDWLPALRLYGEGIFFTLREERLQEWERLPALEERARGFQKRFGQSPVRGPVSQVSARFLLLHTLAHLLIRQLDTATGYPAASLKERIYYTPGTADDQEPMAGILIYVASPDTEGSLGGLVQQAAPLPFLRLLTAAVDAAARCSTDPVCGEQDGHGPWLLNRAACFSCALVPEPSCVYHNVLLDRTFVAGDLGGRCPGFFTPTTTGVGVRDG